MRYGSVKSFLDCYLPTSQYVRPVHKVCPSTSTLWSETFSRTMRDKTIKVEDNTRTQELNAKPEQNEGLSLTSKSSIIIETPYPNYSIRTLNPMSSNLDDHTI